MQVKGVYTALITPFNEASEVNYDKLGEIVERQVAAGVAGVVPMGTTGESPTMFKDEHDGVIRHTVEKAAGRIRVWAGTGSNNTQQAIRTTLIAVKEASGNLGQMADVMARIVRGNDDPFYVVSGDDALTLPLMGIGGHGVISVASNLVPERMKPTSRRRRDWMSGQSVYILTALADGSNSALRGSFEMC